MIPSFTYLVGFLIMNAISKSLKKGISGGLVLVIRSGRLWVLRLLLEP